MNCTIGFRTLILTYRIEKPQFFKLVNGNHIKHLAKVEKCPIKAVDLGEASGR